MKKVIIAILLSIPLIAFGNIQREVQQPGYEFRSTSQMLPQKQNTVVFPVGETSSNSNMRRARGIGDEGEGPGYKPTDPATPIGGAVVPLLLITFGYFLFKKIKKNREIKNSL